MHPPTALSRPRIETRCPTSAWRSLYASLKSRVALASLHRAITGTAAHCRFAWHCGCHALGVTVCPSTGDTDALGAAASGAGTVGTVCAVGALRVAVAVVVLGRQWVSANIEESATKSDRTFMCSHPNFHRATAGDPVVERAQ